jgi:pre-rRNA-processing protein TSR4
MFVGDISVDELQKVTSPEDRQFSKFNLRIRQNPDQVLRYNRGGKPLWISSDHTPSEDDIPCCEYCGQHRQFEFQVSIKPLHPVFIGKLSYIARLLRNVDRPCETE